MIFKSTDILPKDARKLTTMELDQLLEDHKMIEVYPNAGNFFKSDLYPAKYFYLTAYGLKVRTK